MCRTRLSSKDPSKLNIEEKGYYDNISKYLNNGDVKAGWGANKIFGADSAFNVISQYIDNNLFLIDEYHNSPTATMVEKMSTLEKMENEIFTKIIMGAPISDFDTFVAQWKKLGGDQITKEMNESAQ